jgi:hypothetical protein
MGSSWLSLAASSVFCFCFCPRSLARLLVLLVHRLFLVTTFLLLYLRSYSTVTMRGEVSRPAAPIPLFTLPPLCSVPLNLDKIGGRMESWTANT